jgi:hypothetical protein
VQLSSKRFSQLSLLESVLDADDFHTVESIEAIQRVRLAVAAAIVDREVGTCIDDGLVEQEVGFDAVATVSRTGVDAGIARVERSTALIVATVSV